MEDISDRPIKQDLDIIYHDIVDLLKDYYSCAMFIKKVGTMMIKDWDKLLNNIGYDAGIQGRTDFFNSAVMVLLVYLNGEYHFVFQKRSQNIRQSGEICFPGGKHEDGDQTFLQTALRETCEELGIHPERIRVAGRLDTIVAPMGAIIEPYVGIADINMTDLQVNKDEVESIIPIPISYFLDNEPEHHFVLIKMHPYYVDGKKDEEVVLLPSDQLGLPETYRKPWGSFKYPVYVYKTDHGVIWGITARIIFTFIEKLKEISGHLSL